MEQDTWSLAEDRYEEEFLARSESLFSIGNGYLGFRGFFCEREQVHHAGVFINGFHEISPIIYGEEAHGFARFNQTMVDLPDCRFLAVTVDGQRFSMASEGIDSYRKHLDFRTGVLSRNVRWTTKRGVGIEIIWETLISMEHRHVGAVRLDIRCDREAHIEVLSSIGMPLPRALSVLDPRVGAKLTHTSLTCLESSHLPEAHGRLPGFQASFKTIESALHLCCGAFHEYSLPVQANVCSIGEPAMPAYRFSTSTRSFELCKYFYYHTSGRPGEQLTLTEVREKKIDSALLRWHDLLASQKNHFNVFWEHSDVRIDGDEAMQRALRFNLFQLHQSVGRDGMSSLSAKGLTGAGYEGHYFWDTEIYGMPFFTHTDDKTARALIRYRISILEQARSRARELSQRGALYPWRTINGWEASAYFPAGTAQYHINADIAYSIFQYLDITGDMGILAEGGSELLFETARLWLDLGFFNPRMDGRFCIHEVTGPDEYSALVDDNAYTNLMAQEHLLKVCALAKQLQDEWPAEWERVRTVLGLSDEELEAFARAARMMHVPFDHGLGITAQDERFLEKEVWDIGRRGEIRHPMLLYYHPLVIYRHQVIKQADVVLATFLLPQRFPWYLRKRNFDFYEPLTTGDSSLSACIQGIMAYDCGYIALGDAYCRHTALMDLEDLHHNTKDGLHTAAMAGSWMAVIHGVAGYRRERSRAVFRPQLPPGWRCLAYKLTFGRATLEVSIEPDTTTYRCQGGKVTISHRSTVVAVGSEPLALPTKATCKAVIFDLDGVIVSTDRLHYRAWKRLADEQGWSFDEQVNQRLRGVSRRHSLQLILDHNHVVLSETERSLLCDRKNEWYRTSLAHLTQEDVLPGVRELLEELRKQHVALALASASRNAPVIIERLGLADSFDAIVPAEDVAVGKPDPEIFVRAADMLGLYPEECSGVEDAQAGVDALRAAMMRTVGVGPAVDPATCDAHVETIQSLTVPMLLF